MNSCKRLQNRRDLRVCQFKQRLSLRLALFSVAILSHASLIVHANAIRTVALSGQQAPGTGSGVTYALNAPGVLNDAGQVAFHSFLLGPGVDDTNNRGIWSEGSGSLAMVARTGMAAPGTPTGWVFAGLDFVPSLNNAGQIIFFAGLDDDDDLTSNVGDHGIWSNVSGNLALVARHGDQAPGVATGVNFDDVGGAVLNDTGHIAIAPLLTSGSSGIWSNRSGNLAPEVLSGDPAPGTPAGVVFGNRNCCKAFALPAVNNAGQIAFNARLNGNGVNETNDSGIWSDRSGNLALVVRAGDLAPGTPAGVVFGADLVATVPLVGLSDSGQIAFFSGISGPGVSGANNQGIWSDASGSLSLLARTGSHAPGTPGSVDYREFEFPMMNNAGHVQFIAYLTGPGVDYTNDKGIWSEASGSLALIARTGSPAPGTVGDVTFFDFFEPGALNDAGQIAFFALLAGGNVDETNREGIWATDRSGAMHLIVRSGDLLEVAPGDFRTVRYTGFLGDPRNGLGQPTGFNNRGQLAFTAEFTDDSRGIFVSNAVANLPPLPGDYNNDGTVDAADYVLWRKTGGTPGDYEEWRANFGATAVGTAGSALARSQLQAPIPEPAALTLCAFGLAAVGAKRPWKPWRNRRRLIPIGRNVV